MSYYSNREVTKIHPLWDLNVWNIYSLYWSDARFIDKRMPSLLSPFLWLFSANASNASEVPARPVWGSTQTTRSIYTWLSEFLLTCLWLFWPLILDYDTASSFLLLEVTLEFPKERDWILTGQRLVSQCIIPGWSKRCSFLPASGFSLFILRPEFQWTLEVERPNESDAWPTHRSVFLQWLWKKSLLHPLLSSGGRQEREDMWGVPT